MLIPAISIKEPWASMIARGKKDIEVRTWATRHRGRIVLCASKNPPGRYAGKAFALADILEIRPMEPGDEKRTGGYFDPGAYSWVLGNVRRFRPFPVSGRLGLFKIDSKTRTVV